MGALALFAGALSFSPAWADLPQPGHFDARRSGGAGTVASSAWNGATRTLSVVVSGPSGSEYTGSATVCPNDGGFDGAYAGSGCTTTSAIPGTTPAAGQAAFDLTLSGASGAPLYYVILQYRLNSGGSDFGYVEFVYDTGTTRLSAGRRLTTAPTLTSIERADPATEVATANRLNFRVTFSEEVYGVDAADFVLRGGAGEIKQVRQRDAGDTRSIGTDSPSAVWRVAIAGAGLSDHNGPVGLSLASSPTLADVSGANPLTSTTATGTVEGYTVANGPALVIGDPADLAWTAGTQISPLRLPAASGGTAPYEYSLIGTLPEGIRFQPGLRRLSGTPAMAQSATEMTWKVEDSAEAVDQETFTITVNPGPGVTISTSSLTVPEGESRTYTVRLNSQPTADTEVRLVRQGQEGDLRVSPDRLTFTPDNWETPQTVTVRAVADADEVDGSVEFLHRTRSDDPAYEGVDSVKILVTEDDAGDTSAPTVAHTASATEPADGKPVNGQASSSTATGQSVSQEGNEVVWDFPTNASFGRNGGLACLREGATTGAFTARLSTQPTENVRAEIHELFQNTLASLGGGLIVAVDAAGNALDALTFTAANWNVPQSFRFKMPQDDDGEPQDAGFEFRTTSTDAAWDGIEGDNIDICAGDDDPIGWSVTPGALSGQEGDTVTYEIGPKTRPVGGIRLLLSRTNDNANGSVSPSVLTFGYDDWAAKTVRVTLNADSDTDNGTVTVTHTPRSVSGRDTSYAYPVDVRVREIEAAFSLDAPNDLRFTAGEPIEPTRLPVATGGSAPYSYGVSGLPEGLEFDAATRTISGTPSSATTGATVTYTATDDATVTARATTTFTVIVDAAPDVIWSGIMTVGAASDRVHGDRWGYCNRRTNCFGRYGSIYRSQFWLNLDGGRHFLSEVSWSRDGLLRFRVSPGVPRSEMQGWTLIIDGYAVGFRSAIVSTTGSRAQFDSFWGNAPRPAAGDVVPVSIVKRAGPSAPAGAPLTLEAPVNPTWTVGEPGKLHLPVATGGNPDRYRPYDQGTYYYTLTKASGAARPGWLKFNGRHSVLTGRPPAHARDTRLTYTVTDGAGATRSADFTVHVALELAEVEDQTWSTGAAVDFELPEPAGGALPFSYSLSGDLPGGLTFNGNMRPPTITGTPAAAAAATTLTYTATDGNGASEAVTFDVTVEAAGGVTGTSGDAAPALADPEDRTFTAGTDIGTVALTKATGGTAPFTYKLEGPSQSALPDWMTFDGTADPPSITGTPDAAAPALTLTYTATDANGAIAEAQFDVCIAADGSGCDTGSGLGVQFGAHPEWHAGMAFWMEVRFGAEPRLGYRDLRDRLFEVTGGSVYRAQRLEQGSNAGWRLQVLPDAFDDITLTLPATEDCEAEGAVCTAEGERLEEAVSITVPGPGDRLAARMTGHDSPHEGEPFELQLHFNHEPNVAWLDVRDELFAVTGGRIDRAGRLAQGSNVSWRLTVEPAGAGDLTLTLPATQDCAAEGAVCTRDGRKLARGLSVTVEGPTALSVSDAEATEGSGANLSFEVSLSRPRSAETRVDVATRDGTATAGADYEAVTRTLVFAPGETLKTVEVPVLDDAHDEGSETMTLVLSNAEGAPIADAEGTGTIVNTDAIPKAWIARFGRTVTGQVLDAVEARLSEPRQAGMRATLAGQALPSWSGETGAATPGSVSGPANDDETGTGVGASASHGTALAGTEAGDPAVMAAVSDWMARADVGADGLGSGDAFGSEGDLGLGSRSVSGRELLLGTSFALTAGSAAVGGHGSLWGDVSVAGFDGREDGLSLDGEVTTGFLGADWAAERWTAGLALGHSVGTGGYRRGDCEADEQNCGGQIEAELTGLYPYAGLDVNERVSVWLAAGHGAGALSVTPDGQPTIGTDLAMSMGAAGTRVAVLEPEGGEGLRLALKGDGRFTRTSSDAAPAPDSGRLAATEADVWLLRAGIEGSRPFALGATDAGASLTPSFELALRRDGGDAETGFGADLGGGLAFAARQQGLRFDLRGRALVMHEASGFREWGASAAFGFDPRPSSERGLSLSLSQSWGASPSGGMDGLLNRETLAGFAANDDGSGGFEASRRLEGELGYGLPAFGDTFTGTPNLGVGISSGGARDWRLGWRLTSAAPGVAGFELNLDATRREAANDDADHGMMLRSRLRW